MFKVLQTNSYLQEVIQAFMLYVSIKGAIVVQSLNIHMINLFNAHVYHKIMNIIFELFKY